MILEVDLRGENEKERVLGAMSGNVYKLQQSNLIIFSGQFKVKMSIYVYC